MSEAKLLAIKLGDVLKTETTVNELERVASAVFPFPRSPHSNPAITSRIAQLVYDWLLTLEEQDLSEFKKRRLLEKFVVEVAAPTSRARELVGAKRAESAEKREHTAWELIHPLIQQVAKKRFDDGHYADAVEAALKEVNSRVKAMVKGKVGVELDGAKLMHATFSPNRPIIALDDLSTDTGQNIQQGYMEIFAGAMIGIRNPKAHANITISPERALHFLVLASLLMSKLDESVDLRSGLLRPTYEKHNEPSARSWPADKQCQCEDCKEYRSLST